jgi:hypothetical protein
MDSVQVNRNSSRQCTELRQYKYIEYNMKILIHIVLYTGSQVPVVCPQSFSSLALYGVPQNNPPKTNITFFPTLHRHYFLPCFIKATYLLCGLYLSDFGVTFLMKCLSLKLGRVLSNACSIWSFFQLRTCSADDLSNQYPQYYGYNRQHRKAWLLLCLF